MNISPRSCCAMLGLSGLAIGISIAGTSAAPAPQAYCAKVINDDELRGAPHALAPAIKQLFHVTGAYAAQTTRYRCAAGKVMLCNEGANLPCGKANIRRSLPGATAWCKEKPTSNFIPMVATGHDTIYTWHCANGVATPGDPVRKIDARGFFADYWRQLP
jgi:hypothetical protein